MTTSLFEGMKFLIVGDDASNLEFTRWLVHFLGGRVIGSALSNRGALECLRHAQPDVVLSDYLLADAPALPLIEHLDQRHIPYVLVTGMSKSVLPEKLQASQPLSKPFTIQQIVDSVGAALQLQCQIDCKASAAAKRTTRRRGMVYGERVWTEPTCSDKNQSERDVPAQRP